MAKYKLIEDGVKDTETGDCIPFAEGNRHYQEYLEWLKEGNTPIPMQPSPFHKLVDDVWVLDVDSQAKSEQEKMIQAEIRELAIKSLQAKGKLPPDYKDSKTDGKSL